MRNILDLKITHTHTTLLPSVTRLFFVVMFPAVMKQQQDPRRNQYHSNHWPHHWMIRPLPKYPWLVSTIKADLKRLQCHPTKCAWYWRSGEDGSRLPLKSYLATRSTIWAPILKIGPPFDSCKPPEHATRLLPFSFLSSRMPWAKTSACKALGCGVACRSE